MDIIEFVKQQFETNEFLTGATFAAAIASLFYHLRTIPIELYKRLRRKLVYTVRIFQDSNVYDAFEWWLAQNHKKKYRDVEVFAKKSKLGRNMDGGEEDEKKDELLFHHYEDQFLIWYQGAPIYINKFREKMENANDIRSAYLIQFKIVTIFSKNKVNALIEKIYQLFFEDQRLKRNIWVYVNGQYSWNKARIINNSIENVILKSDQKEIIISDLKSFIEETDKYERVGIPHKRGYLFYGTPGNGKTSISLAIASYLKRNIFYFNVTSAKNDADLQSLFSEIKDNSILILEDIDAAFDARENKESITMSGLLNCLDGVFYKEGLITIMTTNHIDKIDPALIRNGRIDLKMEFKNPDQDQVERYVSNFFDIDFKISSYKETYSMAEITEMCLKNDLSVLQKYAETYQIKDIQEDHMILSKNGTNH